MLVRLILALLLALTTACTIRPVCTNGPKQDPPECLPWPQTHGPEVGPLPDI